MSSRVPFDPRIAWWLLAAALCYALGYPLALISHWKGGWVLVFLGGIFLLAAGFLTVRWLHRNSEQTRSAEATQNEARRPD